MIAGIDYRYLKAFHLTAKYLNFSKAASELMIAQSAVSRQIKLLEESMSDQLIVRSSKKVLLTKRGKDLFTAIEHFEQMASEITKSSGPQKIKVGILHGLLETWFIKIIKQYLPQNKHYMNIDVGTPKELKDQLVNGELDLVFSTENIQSDLITSLRLFDETLVVISKNKIDMTKVHQQTWITYSGTDFFSSFKNQSDRMISVKSITAVIKLVIEGLGIAIVPSHTLKGDENLYTYDVNENNKSQIYMSTLNYQTLPKYLQDLINVIKQHIPKN